MATNLIHEQTLRVSAHATLLLAMAGQIDSYWSRRAFSDTFNQVMMQLPQEERSALALVEKGLQRLFGFVHERDYPSQIKPRHLI